MLAKLWDELIGKNGGLGLLYRVAASLCACCFIGGVPTGRGPFAVFRALLEFLSIPATWCGSIAAYLAPGLARTDMIGQIAVIVAVIAALTCGRNSSLGTVPAATLWTCVALAAQCGSPWWPVAVVAVIAWGWSIARSWRDPGRSWGFDAFADTAAAMLGLLLPVAYLVVPSRYHATARA